MISAPCLCLDCRHVHGGRAFGLCLEPGCGCIVPRRWPAPFLGEAEWRAWCASDRVAEAEENVLLCREFYLGGGSGMSERTAAIAALYELLEREPEIASAALQRICASEGSGVAGPELAQVPKAPPQLERPAPLPSDPIPAPERVRRPPAPPGPGTGYRRRARRRELSFVDALALRIAERLRRDLSRHGGR